MKFSRRIDGSICGTRFLLRPSPCLALASSGPATSSWAAGFRACGTLAEPHRGFIPQSRPRCPSPPSVCCRQSAQLAGATVPRCATSATTRTCAHLAVKPAAEETCLEAQTSSSEPAATPSQQPPSREELLSLVGQYDKDDTVQAHLQFFKDPFLRGYAPPNEVDVVVSTTTHDIHAPYWSDMPDMCERDEITLDRMMTGVMARLRNPLLYPSEYIYDLYRQLPEPQMTYLTGVRRHRLLRALARGEQRNSKAMLRYFSVVADVKACGYSLLPSEWNTAMSMAGRYVGTVTQSKLESSLDMWREMEHLAGVRGTEVTFNILFDVAAKAGNFTMAEMVLQEMSHRNIWFNRYHHVSLIYFFGLKQDGDGVRAAFREMVEDGEVIDQVTLNCVMSAFLKCGEEDAAARLYERMKAAHANAAAAWQPRDYNTQKAITKVFMMFARVGRGFPGLRANLQTAIPYTPDLQTFRVLVRHYAIKMAKIDMVARYLDDMKRLQIPVHGGIFLILFKAFAIHGGKESSGSQWSEKRLFGVWEALIQSLDEGTSNMSVDSWMVIWVIRAFDKCGCRRMLVDVYEELASRWDLDEADSDFIAQWMHKKMEKLGLSKSTSLVKTSGPQRRW